MARSTRGARMKRLILLGLFLLGAAAAHAADEKTLFKALTRTQRKQIEKISTELGDENASAAQVQGEFRALVADIAGRRGSLQRLEKIYGSRTAAADGLISYLSAPAEKGAAKSSSDRNSLAQRLQEFQMALRAERERIGDAMSPEAGKSSAWPLMVPDTLDRMKVDIDKLQRRVARKRIGADPTLADAPFLGRYTFSRSLASPEEALAFLQNLGGVERRVSLLAGEQTRADAPVERKDAAKDLLAALRVDALDAFNSNRP
jgi:hypothetical protein